MMTVVGLGPGDPRLLTPEAAESLAAADDLVGYTSYLDRIALRPGQNRHGSDNREEIFRARHALSLAASGRRVAVVSGGDPGVFAMAAAVFEALESGPEDWRALDIRVVPGISALLAASARLGAPLGADFCALSLSDNLKPWPLVLRRLRAAAGAGFVLALYNPASRARPWQLGAALDALREVLPHGTPVAFATALYRPNEHISVEPLGSATGAGVGMSTLVLVGSEGTRRVERPGTSRPWLYTPRSAA